MNYEELVERISDTVGKNCFEKPSHDEIAYLVNLHLSKDIIEFYRLYNPTDVIDINDIRLLPISEIVEENSNYTPGYLLTPLGYCVVATTIEGDVYCTVPAEGNHKVVIASHDEIADGLTAQEMAGKTKAVTSDFISFLGLFVERRLAKSFYEVSA